MTSTKGRWVISLISLEQISGEIAALEEEKPTYVIMQKLADLYTVRDHMVLRDHSLFLEPCGSACGHPSA